MIHKDKSIDFYDERLQLCIVGYLRSEQKFSSFDSLIQQITLDASIADKLTNLNRNFDEETSDLLSSENTKKYYIIRDKCLSILKDSYEMSRRVDDESNALPIWKRINYE